MYTKHTDWMGDLLHSQSPYATKPINQIMIPGSHDSGTFGMSASARTQSLTIGQQLEIGIRYFDFRVRINNGVYYFHHTQGSDNHLCKKGDDPTKPGIPDSYAFKQIRDFLLAHPNEILILKYQNFSEFGHDDYWDLVQLMMKYFTFKQTSPVVSNCALVTLPHGTAAEINKQTLKTLNDMGERVFAFFDLEDVPTDKPTADKIWHHVFQYRPLLEKGKFGLWDPYWHDASSSLGDDATLADMEKWWAWHKTNITTWNKDGFYVLQSHMQQLPGANPYAIYFNISEQVADGNYYLNQDPATGDFYSNNNRNIQHYINWYNAGITVNILMFDYAQYGGVCDAIVNFYKNNIQPIKPAIQYRTTIHLMLNNLDRYIGAYNTSEGYYYPTITGEPVSLMIMNVANTMQPGDVKDGDGVLLITQESGVGDYDQLSAYKTKQLYYYNGSSNHEFWTIRNGSNGGVIHEGDPVWFENQYYTKQFLTYADSYYYLTTAEMDLPTRWVIREANSSAILSTANKEELMSENV
jgi:hypothetical protein